MIDSDATPNPLAAREWAVLRARVRSLTPQTLARAALGTAVIATVGGATLATWPALLPFAVGGLIAYMLLPVVDGLDRVMPRALAAVVAMSGLVAAVIAVVAIVAPPLAAGFVQLARELPTGGQVGTAVSSLEDRVGGLPQGSQAVVVPLLQAVARVVTDLFSGMSNGLDGLVRTVAQGVLTATATILGLIVLPTWMLAVMTERHRVRNAIDARIAPGLRKDTWAIAAIADRAAGSYLRGYVVVAALVGALAYVGASLSPSLGGPTFGQPLALAVFAGTTQVIPVVGPLLGLIPGLLLLAVDPNRAAAYVVIYVIARIVGAGVLGSRITERPLGVHPLVLAPAVIMLGQLGPLWLLLSAPIVAFFADAVRYVHGRLSEPPRPAGVLPRTRQGEAAAAVQGVRVPATYLRPMSPPQSAAIGQSTSIRTR
jgi:predicted PurR-regulated permease PerM